MRDQHRFPAVLSNNSVGHAGRLTPTTARGLVLAIQHPEGTIAVDDWVPAPEGAVLVENHAPGTLCHSKDDSSGFPVARLAIPTVDLSPSHWLVNDGNALALFALAVLPLILRARSSNSVERCHRVRGERGPWAER